MVSIVRKPLRLQIYGIPTQIIEFLIRYGYMILEKVLFNGQLVRDYLSEPKLIKFLSCF